jgi:hypothetical protein
MKLDKLDDDYFRDWIDAMTKRISECDHVFTGVWPHKGTPRMSCMKCFFTRAMTEAEQAKVMTQAKLATKRKKR